MSRPASGRVSSRAPRLVRLPQPAGMTGALPSRPAPAQPPSLPCGPPGTRPGTPGLARRSGPSEVVPEAPPCHRPTAGLSPRLSPSHGRGGRALPPAPSPAPSPRPGRLSPSHGRGGRPSRPSAGPSPRQGLGPPLRPEPPVARPRPAPSHDLAPAGRARPPLGPPRHSDRSAYGAAGLSARLSPSQGRAGRALPPGPSPAPSPRQGLGAPLRPDPPVARLTAERPASLSSRPLPSPTAPPERPPGPGTHRPRPSSPPRAPPPSLRTGLPGAALRTAPGPRLTGPPGAPAPLPDAMYVSIPSCTGAPVPGRA